MASNQMTLVRGRAQVTVEVTLQLLSVLLHIMGLIMEGSMLTVMVGENTPMLTSPTRQHIQLSMLEHKLIHSTCQAEQITGFWSYCEFAAETLSQTFLPKLRLSETLLTCTGV